MAQEYAPRLWLVDGYNVLHAVLLGAGGREGAWWSEPARAGLLARAERLDDPGAEIWVVFDGPRPEAAPGAAAPGARVRRVFAASADEWLVARVRESPQPDRIAVVTADRRVADRARHRGARVVAPAEFLARCGREPAAGPDPGAACG
jgi:predicted RNA-binding protein with PIN domain